MKDLKLIVKINRPVQEVFEFTTNPNNTHKWIHSVVGETAEKFPPDIGTVYKNWDSSHQVNEYTVTRYEPPNIFSSLMRSIKIIRFDIPIQQFQNTKLSSNILSGVNQIDYTLRLCRKF